MAQATNTGTPMVEPIESGLPLAGEPIKLADAERSALFTRLHGYYLEATRDRGTRRDDGTLAPGTGSAAQRKRDWAEYNCEIPPAPKSWPLTGYDGKPHSANVKIPILRAVVDAWVAQVSETMFATRPLIAVDASYSDPNPERARDAEDWGDYYYESILRYPRIAADAHLRLAMEGVGIVHVPYRQDKRLSLGPVETVPNSVLDSDGNPVLDEAGQPKVTYSRKQTGSYETIFDGPRPEVIPLDNFALYPPNVSRIQDAWALFYSYQIDREELAKGRKSGKFTITDDQWAQITGSGGTTTAVAEQESDTTSKSRRVDAIDVYFGYAPKGYEDEVICLATLLPSYNALIWATPSTLGGWKQFVALKARSKGDTLVGLPLPRLVEHLVVMLETVVNQATDHRSLRTYLANTPFVSPTANFNPYEPWLGAPVISTDANGVKFLEIGPDVDWLPTAQFWLDMIERVTGINSNAMGMMLPTNRTATEVSTAATMGSKLFRQQIEMLAIGHAEIREMIDRQMYAAGPSEYKFRREPTREEAEQAKAQGQEPGPVERTVTRDTFRPGLSYTVRGTGQHLDRNAETQEAMGIYEQFKEDPLVVANAEKRYNLAKDVFTAAGKSNPEDYLTKPDAGMSIPALMAQAMPQAPEAPPQDTGPKISISIPFPALPADAQAGLLDMIGLPADGAAMGLGQPVEPVDPMGQDGAFPEQGGGQEMPMDGGAVGAEEPQMPVSMGRGFE